MALYADFNTKVTKGQLIARLDPASLHSKVDEAQANFDAARATAANAQAGIQRAQAAIQAANASVAAALANVVKAGVATQDAEIKGDRRVVLAKEGVLSQEDVDAAEDYPGRRADRGGGFQASIETLAIFSEVEPGGRDHYDRGHPRSGCRNVRQPEYPFRGRQETTGRGA
jgi:multidrug resistance efflux pump